MKLKRAVHKNSGSNGRLDLFNTAFLNVDAPGPT